MRSHRVVDYLVYVAVRLLICAVQAMRIDTAARLAKHLAWLFADVLRLRGEVVDNNLRHAFPQATAQQRRELTRRMWEHLFLLVLEVAHAPRKIHETNWRNYVHVKDAQPLVRQLLTGGATLIVTGHFGNFEVAGYALGVLGFPTHTIARKLDNPYLDRFVNRFREATGQYIIPKVGGYDQILDVLDGGGTLTFLADQYAGPKGCWVEFFRRPASAHKAIALFALNHEAPVVVSYARRLERPMHFELGVTAIYDLRKADDEPPSVRRLTQWFTTEMEAFIRRDPQQYWWIHRRWKGAHSRRIKQRKEAA